MATGRRTGYQLTCKERNNLIRTVCSEPHIILTSLESKLFLWVPVWSKIIFQKKSLIFKAQNQQPDQRSLRKTYIQKRKIPYRIELHTGPRTAESTFKFGSTLDRCVKEIPAATASMWISRKVKNQLDTTKYAVLLPQHVSGTNMPIIRSTINK
jgi:hypothetical protein